MPNESAEKTKDGDAKGNAVPRVKRAVPIFPRPDFIPPPGAIGWPVPAMPPPDPFYYHFVQGQVPHPYQPYPLPYAPLGESGPYYHFNNGASAYGAPSAGNAHVVLPASPIRPQTFSSNNGAVEHIHEIQGNPVSLALGAPNHAHVVLPASPMQSPQAFPANRGVLEHVPESQVNPRKAAFGAPPANYTQALPVQKIGDNADCNEESPEAPTFGALPDNNANVLLMQNIGENAQCSQATYEAPAVGPHPVNNAHVVPIKPFPQGKSIVEDVRESQESLGAPASGTPPVNTAHITHMHDANAAPILSQQSQKQRRWFPDIVIGKKRISTTDAGHLKASSSDDLPPKKRKYWVSNLKRSQNLGGTEQEITRSYQKRLNTRRIKCNCGESECRGWKYQIPGSPSREAANETSFGKPAATAAQKGQEQFSDIELTEEIVERYRVGISSWKVKHVS